MLAFPGFDTPHQFSLLSTRHDLDTKAESFEGSFGFFPSEAHLHIDIKRLIN
jgi:hypothetical protein